MGNDADILFLRDVDGCVDYRSGLHLCNFGVRNRQTAAAVAHHRVKLVQAGNDFFQLCHGQAQFFRNLFDVLFLGGQELMQGRVDEADNDRQFFHDIIDALEVALLIGQQLCQCLAAGFGGFCHNHFTHCFDAVALKEHVLGTAQANALCAECLALCGVVRCVCVGVNLQTAHLVSPVHIFVKIARNRSFYSRDSRAIDVAGRAVN